MFIVGSFVSGIYLFSAAWMDSSYVFVKSIFNVYDYLDSLVSILLIFICSGPEPILLRRLTVAEQHTYGANDTTED